MRRIRRLFLPAILIIVGAVGARYWFQRAEQIAAAPPPPVSLPRNTQAQSRDWIYNYSVDQRPVVEVRARDMRHVREPDVLQLDHVQLRLFRKDGKQYDHVKSASAVFDRPAGALVSEGNVEITLGVPVDEAKTGRARLLTIRSSGIRFEEKTGKASTNKPASFRFDRGEGSSVGAEYDPATRALVMRSQVKLRWGANGPDGRAMDVEAGELTYQESESKIFLLHGARLRRGGMTLESTDAVVTLEDGEIRLVEARQARGADAQPGRNVSYGADNLVLTFAAKGAVEKISGEGKARLSAATGASTTSM
ncbi:MAG: LPS export ABC transporter periplasmic protein LptC, partial [Bryobacteraceae bacterium]